MSPIVSFMYGGALIRAGALNGDNTVVYRIITDFTVGLAICTKI